MTRRERIYGLLLLLTVAAALLFYRQQANLDLQSSLPNAGVPHPPSPEFMMEFAKTVEAEQVKDPVSRCLAYPNPQEFRWDPKLIEARCQRLGLRMISWKEINALLDNNQSEVLDRTFDEYLAKNFSDPEHHGYLIWTFGWMFQNSSKNVEATTQRWIVESPQSAYARAARGMHYVASAFAARGTAFARDVPPENFMRMHEFTDKARADLEFSLLINPRLIAAYHGLLSVARLTSDRNLVSSSVEKALALDPADPWIYSDWIDAADPRWGGSFEDIRAIGEKAESHKDSEPLLLLDRAAPSCAKAREFECTLCGHPPDYSAALRELRNAGAFGPVPCFLERAGEVAATLHDYEDAARYYSQTIRFGDQAYAWRALALEHLGQYDKAVADLDKAMEIGPRNVEALYTRARVFIDMTRYADAEDAYLKILTINPANESAAVGLSMLYLSKLPKPDKAEQLVSKLVDNYPSHARPWLLKAAVAHDKDPSICREALAKYLQLVNRDDPYEKADIERAKKELADVKPL